MLLYNVCLVVGIFSVIFCSNWLLIWFWLELMTLSLVVLLSSPFTSRSVEATSKYFVVQAVAGLFVLGGVLSRYYFVGEVVFFSYYNSFSYFLIIFGLLVKLAVFPKPFWFIDVVSGLSLFRAVYVVLVSKVVPLYLICSLMSSVVGQVFVLVGIGSVFWGTFLGINQTSVRKILAFSSVAQLGWMLAGFPFLAWKTCLFVFFSYVFMLVPFFWIGGMSSLNYLVKSKKVYFKPFGVLCLILAFLSLGGFPPFLGFFYKWVIFYGLVTSGLYLAGGCLVVLSLVSLFFYLQVCYSLWSVYWPELKLSLVGGVSLAVFGSYSSGGVVFSSVCVILIVLGWAGLGPLCLAWFF